MPESDNSMRYVVVGLCSFCKWPIANAIPDKEAETILQWFLEFVVS